MAVQNQALAFDASVLSNSFGNQANQLKQTSTILIFATLGVFGAYFISVYFLVYRRTLSSIAKLQKGTEIIGSGNLDYSIASKSDDEIGELSRSFNQMTTNLKTVTASKTDLERAQASLRESEQRWSTTLASIGDAVIATDNSGKITFMNTEAEDLTGWTLNEASLKSVKEVFNIVNEQTRIEVEDPVSKVLEKGIIVGLANHTVLIRKNKTEVAIDDSGAPIKDKEGKTTGVVLIFRDITERKKAEEALRLSEERFSKAFSLSPVAVIITRYTDGYYVDVNDTFLKIFGYVRSEVIGHSSNELRIYAKPDGRAEYLAAFKNGRVTDLELDLQSKTGKPVKGLLFSETLNVNGQELILSTLVDITGRKQAEEKLEEYRNNLERLVEERTKQLKDSERLAAIGATAGMVGHDIRNPLQAITGDLYLAKTDLASIPESEEKQTIQESLTEIEKNIDYINKIVQDLQDYARPLNPNPGEADLKLIIEKMLQKNSIPENVKISVKVEDQARRIVADADYLNRILYNLVINAVQAMPKGGKLTIHVFKEEKDVIISVKDTGVGIPEAVKGKLFTPMFTTKSKGQGFGLPVIKRMTESLGGTVSFESQEGKGTTFKVRLPQKH